MTGLDPWVPGWPVAGVPRSRVVEFGVVEHGGVAGGAGDGEPEQVAEAAHVTAGGVQFVEDAVFADGLGGHAEGVRDPSHPHWGGAQRAALAADRWVEEKLYAAAITAGHLPTGDDTP